MMRRDERGSNGVTLRDALGEIGVWPNQVERRHHAYHGRARGSSSRPEPGRRGRRSRRQRWRHTAHRSVRRRKSTHRRASGSGAAPATGARSPPAGARCPTAGLRVQGKSAPSPGRNKQERPRDPSEGKDEHAEPDLRNETAASPSPPHAQDASRRRDDSTADCGSSSKSSAEVAIHTQGLRCAAPAGRTPCAAWRGDQQGRRGTRRVRGEHTAAAWTCPSARCWPPSSFFQVQVQREASIQNHLNGLKWSGAQLPDLEARTLPAARVGVGGDGGVGRSALKPGGPGGGSFEPTPREATRRSHHNPQPSSPRQAMAAADVMRAPPGFGHSPGMSYYDYDGVRLTDQRLVVDQTGTPRLSRARSRGSTPPRRCVRPCFLRAVDAHACPGLAQRPGPARSRVRARECGVRARR